MLKNYGMKLNITIFNNGDSNNYEDFIIFNDNTTVDNYLYKLFTYLNNELIHSDNFHWYVDTQADEFIDWLHDKDDTIDSDSIDYDYTLYTYYTDMFINEMIDKLTDDKFYSYEQIDTICNFIDTNSNVSIEWENFCVKVI